jgi:hypothetical protein
MQPVNQLDIEKIKQQALETSLEVVAGTGINVKKIGNQVVVSVVPQNNTIIPIYVCVNGVPRKINVVTKGNDFSPSFPIPPA